MFVIKSIVLFENQNQNLIKARISAKIMVNPADQAEADLSPKSAKLAATPADEAVATKVVPVMESHFPSVQVFICYS